MKAPRPKPPAPVPLMLEHDFTRGCHYENMKGTYEVLSIDGDTMRIRWESGEESVTDIKLQDRILSRFEREARAAKAHPGTRPEEPESRLGAPFRGLVAADFTLPAAQTTWRSRTSGFGSSVAQELEGSEFCFGFRVPFREPMILWADVDQKAGGSAELQSGFFCRLDEARAYYGFFVARSGNEDGKGTWHRFLEWLNVPENEESLRSLAAESGLRVFDCRETSASLQPTAAQWEWAEDDACTDVPSLGAFLLSRPADPGTFVECAAVVEKDRAVRRGLKLGRDVAKTFEQLMPLYRACLGAAAVEKKASKPARRRAAS